MPVSAGGRDQNELVGVCAWFAMAFLQHQADFEHRHAFSLPEIIHQVSRARPAPEAPTRIALELLQTQGWALERDGAWSLTESGRRLELPSIAGLATLLGLDAAERAERARRHREAISRLQDVVDADLQALSRALAAGGLDPAGLAPLFPTVEPRVYHLAVSGTTAFAAWQAMRDRVDDTGFWPVVLDDPDGVELDALQSERWLAEEPTAEQSLAEAAATEPEAWLAARAREREEFRLRLRLPEQPYPHGPWPEGRVPRRALYPPKGDVATLGLFPTPRSWEVPAYLRWFVGNADLRPADHVRLQRRWAERYGAELVNVQDQAVAQFRVAYPAGDRESALRLAVEHFEYCPDRVFQSTDEETLEALAAELLDAPVWYFWWD
jgi:hypothetical protein